MKIRIIAITKNPDLKSAEKTLENWVLIAQIVL